MLDLLRPEDSMVVSPLQLCYIGLQVKLMGDRQGRRVAFTQSRRKCCCVAVSLTSIICPTNSIYCCFALLLYSLSPLLLSSPSLALRDHYLQLTLPLRCASAASIEALLHIRWLAIYPDKVRRTHCILATLISIVLYRLLICYVS